MLDYARVTRLGYVTRHAQLPISDAQQKLLHRRTEDGVSFPVGPTSESKCYSYFCKQNVSIELLS